MFALVALLLFCIRMVLKRRRVRRTSELRSSWFYGGDVDEPVEEYRNETDVGSSVCIQSTLRFFLFSDA